MMAAQSSTVMLAPCAALAPTYKRKGMTMEKVSYRDMTDEQRATALWSHSLQIERLKRRRKALKDSPPTDQMAAEYIGELDNVAAEIKLARAEVKALWKQVIA